MSRSGTSGASAPRGSLSPKERRTERSIALVRTSDAASRSPKYRADSIPENAPDFSARIRSNSRTGQPNAKRSGI